MIKNVPYNKNAKGTIHYIDKAQLNAIVQKCIDNDRTVSNELAKAWELIIDHMLQARNFNFYSDAVKEDMKSFAYMKLLRSMKSVDLSKCQSAFGYYSRIIYLAFISELGKKKREDDKIKSIRDDLNKALTFMKYMNTDSRAEY